MRKQERINGCNELQRQKYSGDAIRGWLHRHQFRHGLVHGLLPPPLRRRRPGERP